MVKKIHEADYVLVAALVGLLLFGLLVLSSAGSAVAFERFQDQYFFVKRQFLFGVIPGILAFLFLARVRFSLLKSVSVPFFFISCIFLLLVFVPGVGASFDTGANSWISFGGISFQPAELMKLSLVLFLAFLLTKIGTTLGDAQHGFLPVLGLGMIPVVLVMLQPDVGTVAILFSIVFGMLFVARARMSHLCALAAVGVVGLVIMILIAPYRTARLTTFLHPELDPQGIGYHINQAFLAIGSGGLTGLGLGHSRQKFQYLPEVHADSIFAVIAEEMGFIISVGFLFLLLFIIFRSLVIAKRTSDPYMRLVVAGIVVWFAVQSFMNIGAMVGLMPITGVPLPLVSHGGTALLISLASMGIVVNASRHVARST